MWGTCLCLRGPSLWMTINPSDTHDPIAQCFIGEMINLDDFNPHASPDSNQQAQNIARGPFAAVKYFFFIIKAILLHLFQVNVTSHQVHSGMGVLEQISGYFGVIEAQGQWTLHVYMMIWLQHTPNMVELHTLLYNDGFCAHVRNYIQQNIRTYVDGLDEETIWSTPKESSLPYSRPPNPDSGTWQVELQDVECCVVRSQQVHTCSRATCLQETCTMAVVAC